MTSDAGAASRSRDSEWPDGLDVGGLLEDGWRPVPFRQFVVKIHSRCNLACAYCYMYEAADQSWREQPRRMSAATIEATAARIGEHAWSHGLSDIELIVHGGEPLLAGPEALRHLVTAVRAAAGSEVAVAACVQTNGVLLDTTFLDLFAELDVRVSASLGAVGRAGASVGFGVSARSGEDVHIS